MNKPESTSAFAVGGAWANGNRHDGLGLAEHIEIDIPKGRGRAGAVRTIRTWCAWRVPPTLPSCLLGRQKTA